MGQKCCTVQRTKTPTYGISSIPIQKLRTAKTQFSPNKIKSHQPQKKNNKVKEVESMNSIALDAKKVQATLHPLEIPKYLVKDFLETDLPELGPFLYSNGETYTGQYQNGMRHGYGVQISKNGIIYEGMWIEDVCNLYGRLIHPDGTIYEGEIKNGQAHGKGKSLAPNGSSYEGRWIEGMMDGYGVEFLSDGSKYFGDFSNNLKEGKGYLIFSDGSDYQGDFKKGQRNGFGVHVRRDGSKYEGEWENDKMQGLGVFTWPNGNFYHGNYVNSLKEGFGELR